MLTQMFDVLSEPFLFVGSTIGEALAVFDSVAYTSLPVVDGAGKYAGVADYKVLAGKRDGMPGDCLLAEWITPVRPLLENTHVEMVIAQIHADVAPLVNDDNLLLGFITKENVLKNMIRYYAQLAERNRKLLESSYNGILAIDQDSNISVFNPAAERILGRRRADVIGRHISLLDPNMGLLGNMLQPSVTTGIHTEINGVKIIANRTPLMFEGGCAGAMSVFMDVSEYENVCNELAVSKHLMHEMVAIFESSYDGFFIADAHGRVTRVNSAWEKICGFSRQEVIGKTAYELVEMGCYDKSAAVAAIEEKRTVTMLTNITNGPRKGTQVMTTGTPIFDDAGTLAQVVVNVRDMTNLEDLRRQLESTVELNRRYASELERIRQQHTRSGGITANSKEMQRILEMVERLATVNSTVLIMGESGVGKELIANSIHACSRRKGQPFIKINCGAIPEHLLESELFGYVGGAFTGAKREGKPGMFELAANGTLFLDEVGELPLGLQVKLLRVLQEKTLVRVGGVKPIPVDVRVIAATNRNLPEMVRRGTFRDDLFYRLNVFVIQIPPLRQRREDLPPLLHTVLEKFNQKYGMKKSLSPAATERLLAYDWPGNVREMENLLERLVVLVNEPVIEVMHLPDVLQPEGREPAPNNGAVSVSRLVPYKTALEELERSLLLKALSDCGSTRKVAERLQVNQSTIVRKMQQYNITKGARDEEPEILHRM